MEERKLPLLLVFNEWGTIWCNAGSVYADVRAALCTVPSASFSNYKARMAEEMLSAREKNAVQAVLL